jgi:CRISPR system Cascade subunit CasE
MAYLSRIFLNTARRSTRDLLASPQRVHGAVYAGLVDVAADRPLWRLDADPGKRAALYVVTRARPDWTHVVEQAGWPDAKGDQVVVRSYDPLLTAIAEGNEFAFRLTANPVYSIRDYKRFPQKEGKRDRGHVVNHVTVEQQLKWLVDRASQYGFEIPVTSEKAAQQVQLIGREKLSFRKGSGGPVVISTASYQGRLIVTDAERIREKLLSGIGKAKAYGCGLLTLASVGR